MNRYPDMPKPAPTLLCVSNYPPNTGYAWDFIEGLYARVADHLATHGIGTLVAYPKLDSSPRTLDGSAARAVRLDASLETTESVEATIAVIRQNNVRVIYFTDRPARHVRYPRLRRAGARYIIVHDHSSGEWTRPRGSRRALKWVLGRTPGLVADVIVAVSEFVRRRQIDAGMIPPARVVTVWNGVTVPPPASSIEKSVHRELGISPDRQLIVCACRAAPEKGVAHLLRAFDRVAQTVGRDRKGAFLVYLGDGPQFGELKELHESLAAKEDILLAGYRANAKAIVAGADICVVPSVWQDAFPLSVLEAMAAGKAVIASRVGGIPEMIEDCVSGVLVPPGDEEALAEAIRKLIAEPEISGRLGISARHRVAELFTPELQLRKLTSIIEKGFDVQCGETRSQICKPGF